MRNLKKKQKSKIIILRILFLVTTVCFLGILYSLSYSYSANASKLPLKTEKKYVHIPENIGPPHQILVKNTNISSSTDEGLVPDTLPIVTVEAQNQINQNGVSSELALVPDGKKTAYLTFDDGPSLTVTPLVLEVLKKYKVNGTFFLIGQSVDSNEQCKNLVREIYKDGNAIGNHTYTHNLKNLYPNNIINVPYLMSELSQTEKSLRDVLGSNFGTSLLRLPGGLMSRTHYKDPNLNELSSKLNENNMHAIDWNASVSDAEGGKKNSIQLLNSLKTTVGSQQKVVILMHDTYGKEETAKALPKIIEYLKARGYEFKTLK